MRHYIAVGVTYKARFAWPVQSSQKQLSILTELVNINSDTNSQHRITQSARDLGEIG